MSKEKRLKQLGKKPDIVYVKMKKQNYYSMDQYLKIEKSGEQQSELTYYS